MGPVVPGASVTATAVGTNIKASTRTDSSGNYVLTPLKIGNYSVSVESQGFKTETRSGVTLQIQDRLRVDFAFGCGRGLGAGVSVVADVPLIQTETSSLGDVIASKQITDLPLNGRITPARHPHHRNHQDHRERWRHQRRNFRDQWECRRQFRRKWHPREPEQFHAGWH